MSSLLLALGPAALHFLGDQACPVQASVEAQVRRIDPGAFDRKTRHLALIEPRADGLEVRLFDEDGRLLEQRLLNGSKTCPEWARIAAALLATWETDLAAPDLAFGDQPSAAGMSATPTVASSQAVTPAGHEHVLQLEVGLGAGGAGAGADSLAAGGEILAGLGPRGGAYGGELTLNGTTSRSLAVGTGSAQWQRTSLSLGGYGTFSAGGSDEWKLELGAAVLAGVLSASGTGFLVARSGSTLEAGVEVMPRLRWNFAPHWLLWGQFGGAVWLKAETVQVLAGSSAISSAQIPSVDASAMLGLSFLVDL